MYGEHRFCRCACKKVFTWCLYHGCCCCGSCTRQLLSYRFQAKIHMCPKLRVAKSYSFHFARPKNLSTKLQTLPFGINHMWLYARVCVCQSVCVCVFLCAPMSQQLWIFSDVIHFFGRTFKRNLCTVLHLLSVLLLLFIVTCYAITLSSCCCFCS